MKNRKLVIILVSVFSFLMLIGGTSYAYFIYSKDIADVSVETGNMSINFSNSNNINLSNILPLSTSVGMSSSNYIDFTINGTVDTERIYYEVYVVPNGNSTMSSNDINNYVRVYLTDQSNNAIKSARLYKYLNNSTKSNGKILYQAVIEPNSNGTVKNENKDFRLRVWLDENYTGSSGATFNFSIYLYAINVDENFEAPLSGVDMVKKGIQDKINAPTGACTPVWYDDINNTPSDNSDDVIYFSGTKTCVDMNFVWYSGKLWRITAIYPDGTMKMISEDGIAAVNWGSSIEFNGSWIYQWLNEDFYDTLANLDDIIVTNGIWNYSTDENDTPVRPETINTQKTVQAPVGLLTAYEFYNSYRNTTATNSFLKQNFYWWVITPKSGTELRRIDKSGTYLIVSPSGVTANIRPVVYLKKGLDFTGSGTKSNPYQIIGDKTTPSAGTNINTRSVGEYIRFDNNIYRIVEIDEKLGTTKITSVDYVRDNGTVVTKALGSTVYFGKEGNTETDDYWDYYLNNTWYGNISSSYKNMLVDDVYYLGSSTNNKHYKATICSDSASDLNNLSVKECTKYTSNNANKTFTGKVGLQRAGEMFSMFILYDGISFVNMLTISPYSGSQMRYVISSSGVLTQASVTTARAARPSVTLSPNVIITSGTGYIGGDTSSPFEISLSNN